MIEDWKEIARQQAESLLKKIEEGEQVILVSLDEILRHQKIKPVPVLLVENIRSKLEPLPEEIFLDTPKKISHPKFSRRIKQPVIAQKVPIKRFQRKNINPRGK